MFQGGNSLTVYQFDVLIQKIKSELIKITGNGTFFCQTHINITVVHHNRNRVPCEMNVKFKSVHTVILIIQHTQDRIFRKRWIGYCLHTMMGIYFEWSIFSVSREIPGK